MDLDQLTLGQVLRRARREFPHREVVSRERTGVLTTTYADLFERVDRLAHALGGLGVRRGDRVATVGWNHRRHLELYLAVTATGAVLHTVNTRLAPDQLRAVIEHAGDVVLFAEDEVAAEHAEWFGARGGRPVVGFDGEVGAAALGYDDLLAGQPGSAFRYPELDEREPAAMAYSSATTGRPKGVLYSHRALYLHTMMVCLADTWAISEADTVLPVVPMFHVNAWGLPFASIWMGARLVLPGVRPTAEDLLPLLDGVTFAAAVPTVWMDVFTRMEENGIRLPSLRTVVSGGAPLPAALLRRADRLGVPMIHSYGMTEASPLVLVGQVRSDLEATEDRRLKQGFVVPGLDYEIAQDPGSGPEPDGRQRGELRLRGPWIVDGYERDERSAGAFVDGWYHTGDIVVRDDDGYLHVVDRKADLIKSGGEWISTLELEDALSTYPGVTAAAVVGVPDVRWQERPRAYLVTAHPVDVVAMKESLAQRFPRFWIPDEFVLTDSLPLTAVGKYDKKRLRAEGGPSSA
jgi:acyl-CoA synthetase (AMP-forming)/AMP-acid ligase II